MARERRQRRNGSTTSPRVGGRAGASVAGGRWGARRSSPSGSRSGVAPAGRASAEGRPPETAGCTPRGRGRSDHRDGTARPGTGTAQVPDPADVMRPAVVAGFEQSADAAEAGGLAAEAGGLEVAHAGWPWQCLDVANRVDRPVPRDPVSVAVEHAMVRSATAGSSIQAPGSRSNTRRNSSGSGSMSTVALRSDPSCRPHRRRRAMPALREGRHPSSRSHRA